jgi:hypothetical protein
VPGVEVEIIYGWDHRYFWEYSSYRWRPEHRASPPTNHKSILFYPQTSGTIVPPSSLESRLYKGNPFSALLKSTYNCRIKLECIKPEKGVWKEFGLITQGMRWRSSLSTTSKSWSSTYRLVNINSGRGKRYSRTFIHGDATRHIYIFKPLVFSLHHSRESKAAREQQSKIVIKNS